MIDYHHGRDNLEAMFHQADAIDMNEGCHSYHKYQHMMNSIADEYEHGIEEVTAAFCAMSPNNDYVGNLRSVVSVLVGLRDGVPYDEIVISTYNHCKFRAISYFHGEPFLTPERGPKIASFYRNIIDPDCPHYVTIDGHIAAAYEGNPNLKMKDVLMSKKEYRKIGNAVISLADQYGLIGNQLQAIIWFTRKRLLKIKHTPVVDMFYDSNDLNRIIIPINQLKTFPLRAEKNLPVDRFGFDYQPHQMGLAI